MNKKLYFLLFIIFFCFKSVELPKDFELNVYIRANLMPGPLPRKGILKGFIELKGTFAENPQIKKVSILYKNMEFGIPFEKNKRENVWVLKFPVKIIPQIKEKKYLKFKIVISYKGKMFEIIKDKIKIIRIY